MQASRCVLNGNSWNWTIKVYLNWSPQTTPSPYTYSIHIVKQFQIIFNRMDVQYISRIIIVNIKIFQHTFLSFFTIIVVIYAKKILFPHCFILFLFKHYIRQQLSTPEWIIKKFHTTYMDVEKKRIFFAQHFDEYFNT